MSIATLRRRCSAASALSRCFLSCYGASPAFLVEAFPKHVRCSGLSVGYNLAQSVFGGTVPMVAVYLTKMTGDPLAPAFYLSIAGVVSLLMASLIGHDESAARDVAGETRRHATFAPERLEIAGAVD